MKRLLLRSMVGAGAVLVVLVLLVGCGSTPQPTEPPPTQTPWVVIVTSTAAPTQAAAVQATATTAPAAKPTEPTEPPPTKAPTRTSAAADTTPETATATTEAQEASTPTATTEPTATTAAAAPTKAPQPTATETSFGIKYAPPVLLEPSNNQSISWQGTMTFKWVPVGELAAEEYYVVEFYRPARGGVDAYGDYFYVKEPEFVWQGSAKDPFHPPESQGDAVVEWWVRVVQKTGQDSQGKDIGIDISVPSERRTLILRAKPEG
ncbi:MAG: hypothetical protein P8129_02730 [Anaerolineae bacterium]|jgi:hypothetical protein